MKNTEWYDLKKAKIETKRVKKIKQKKEELNENKSLP